ncbi:MAG TPA: FtsX-like permease family protein [Bacteroidota bacterium]|jgi:putative ABC transport system permease protein|nr:FtsX-like permease family protein [Bacteroidota bacterium]
MLKNYFKIALKVLLRRKFYTFISLFAISFTLVVLMVATAILDHMFAPMAPETNLDRLLCVFHMDLVGPEAQWNGNPGYGFLDKYVRGLHNVERFSIASEERTVTSYKDGAEIKSMLKRTDGEFWKILDFKFIEGRPIDGDDDAKANFVCVINDATRKRFFGDQSALGKFIEADRQRFQVIGVVENVPAMRHIPYADIWVPNSTSPEVNYKEKLMGGNMGLLLARDKNDFDLIRQEFASRLPQVQIVDHNYERMQGRPDTYFEGVAREAVDDDNAVLFTAVIVILMFLFMLLPTINLININISRILERSSEIGVRKSFGASAWTLVGQFIVENLVLTAIGGIFGFILTQIILQILNSSGLIEFAHFTLNLRVFGYGILLILVFGLLSGVYPAWRMSRMQPVLALKGVVR